MMRLSACLRTPTLAALAAVACGATGFSCRDERASARPSIIVVTIDTIRADHLSCYGYFRNTSPEMDRFASEAVLFENALTPMATTLPAHVSLFTSTNPIQHGIKGNFEQLARKFSSGEGVRTLAELLAGQGYATAAFVSATPVKKSSGIDAGFALFDEPSGKERDATATTDRAIAWLEAGASRPFLLWVHYFDPHEPYRPPDRYRLFADEPGLGEFLKRNAFPDPDDEAIHEAQNLYDGEVRHVDEQIGRLFDTLRGEDLYASSAIVVTGDHGEGLGQHGWMGHGHIYNEQLFVPLILKLPASNGLRPRRAADLASLLDVVPTLAGQGIVSLPPEVTSRLEGIDLLALGRDAPSAAEASSVPAAAPADPDPPGRYLLAERVNRERNWEPGLKYALVGLKWKYVHLTQGADQLFDMTADRAETVDLLASQPDIAAALKGRLLREISDLQARGAGRTGEGVPAEVVEELRSLGYVQ